MQTIILKPLHHRSKECIGIYFERNALLQSLIQKEIGARWSKTNSCWYCPLTKSDYENLAKILMGKAILETDELKKYLLDKKTGSLIITHHTKSQPAEIKKGPIKKTAPLHQAELVSFRVANLSKVSNPNSPISKENNEALQKFKQQLIHPVGLKKYEQCTTMFTSC